MVDMWPFGKKKDDGSEKDDDDVVDDDVCTPLAKGDRLRFLAESASFYDGVYGSGSTHLPPERDTIRFQVVLWYVGPVDVVLGKVDMRFRVTAFWNVPAQTEDKVVGYGMHNPSHKKVWTMHGRQRAYERQLHEIIEGDRLIYVPPVSILNAVDFEVLGDPEVCLVDEESNLMKWSCLYKASLLQEDLKVANFPHDEHELVIRIGILKHRQPGKRWDRRRWKLALATEDDTGDSIRIPYGLIVDHVKVPGFSYAPKGLDFEFVPLEYGAISPDQQLDKCLHVKLKIKRNSSYYDRNIIPLLACLNVTALSTLALNAKKFGSRGSIILAAAFVEIGIRMTIDRRLPVVGYQIKMQEILNKFFYGLLFLVLESSLVFGMNRIGYPKQMINMVDIAAVLLELVYLSGLVLLYYYSEFT